MIPQKGVADPALWNAEKSANNCSIAVTLLKTHFKRQKVAAYYLNLITG